MDNFHERAIVQQAAKQVLAEVAETIAPDSTEQTIAVLASRRLAELGFPDTWYYDCAALVLAGQRTCLSVSGRDYVPADEPVGTHNLVTVDLSPCDGPLWGDCARSFVVEDGRVAVAPQQPEFRRGLDVETQLHAEMRRLVTPQTSFHALHELANERIAAAGFENLDFLGNVGHSIAETLDARLFVEAGNHTALGSVPCFTLEPHIRTIDGHWGFKHENIYYFDGDGRVAEL